MAAPPAVAATGNAFERLHPSLRHAIVHELGWRSLRPVQQLAVHAILDGSNAVVLAPTAGGKTEASLFPVLSDILDARDAEPVGEDGLRETVRALYVCPIRALLNNQEGRVQSYTRMVGLDAFKWHGDVAASRKAAFKSQPTSVLMITPESLEVMLISASTDAAQLFRHLQAVIVDEVHAFAADDRGAHLVCILERLNRLCERDLQRIGLSATVGNPEQIGAWIQGSSERPFALVDPPRPTAQRDLSVELFDDLDHAARAAAGLAHGKKSLVFVGSRADAERTAAAMKGPPGRRSDLEIFVHHSAVSRADRQLAESRFTAGGNTAIVCTSTLELGVDVGDLDRVLQVESPSTVASLLQRMGRTGRRAGTRPNLAVLTLKAETLLQAIALLRLTERGWVEDVVPVADAAHILAHQILALSLQLGGVSRHRVFDHVAPAYAVRGLTENDVGELIDTMVEREILYEADGLLSLGAEGERLYGRKNFFELYAVFSAPAVMKVMYRRTEIGTVQSLFIRSCMADDEPLLFRLGGESWAVTYVDFDKGIVQVQRADRGRVPRWFGPPNFLSYEVCQEMKAVLRETARPAWLGDGGWRELRLLRESYDGLVEDGEAPLESVGGSHQWHTFAGGRINRLLAHALMRKGLGRWTAGNLTLKTQEPLSAVAVRAAIDELRDHDWQAEAQHLVQGVQNSGLSKFEPCLPERLALGLKVERLTDVERTERFEERTRVPISD